jgi:hypothetical protein
MLTAQRIEALSKLKGVKSIAVQNFLGSLDGLTASEAHSNLKMDARLYKWNAATVRVITHGLIEHFGR